MSEMYEISADVDGDGSNDYIVAEQYDDGSIVTTADLDGDGLIDVATYDANGDGVAEDTWVTPGGYSSLEGADYSEATVTETYTAEVSSDGYVTETYTSETTIS